MFKISLLLLLFVLTTIVNANMIDVLTPYMKAPSSCKHGCADWTTYETKIWNNNRTFSISKFPSLTSFFLLIEIPLQKFQKVQRIIVHNRDLL